MPSIGLPEMILVGAVALLLFGAKKLPDAARSIGQSFHAFKKGLKEGEEELKKATEIKSEEPKKEEKGSSAEHESNKS